MVNGDRISRGHESSTMAWHGIVREERACCHFAVVDVVDVIGMDGMSEVGVCAMKRKAFLLRDDIEEMRNVLFQT